METSDGVVGDSPDAASFEVFLTASERRLRVALIVAYGPVDGRDAAFDALSWAWEHWAEVRSMNNPLGYLFRVGQTAARRAHTRPFPIDAVSTLSGDQSFGLDVELLAGLSALSEQQRLVVMLVHAFGWTIRETADALELAPSTVQTHAERGLARMRSILEACNVNHD